MHVVTPHNLDQPAHDDPLDVFSANLPDDPNFMAPRPRYDGKPKAAAALGFRPDGWWTERSDNMAQPKGQVAARIANGEFPRVMDVFSSIRKIGSQVWKKNYYQQVTKPGTVRWAPVAFPNQSVVWVGVLVDLRKAGTETAFFIRPESIYPFHSDKKSQQGQRYYEKNLK